MRDVVVDAAVTTDLAICGPRHHHGPRHHQTTGMQASRAPARPLAGSVSSAWMTTERAPCTGTKAPRDGPGRATAGDLRSRTSCSSSMTGGEGRVVVRPRGGAVAGVHGPLCRWAP